MLFQDKILIAIIPVCFRSGRGRKICVRRYNRRKCSDSSNIAVGYAANSPDKAHISASREDDLEIVAYAGSYVNWYDCPFGN